PVQTLPWRNTRSAWEAEGGAAAPTARAPSRTSGSVGLICARDSSRPCEILRVGGAKPTGDSSMTRAVSNGRTPLVVLVVASSAALLTGDGAAVEAPPSALPAGYSVTRTGDVHDFDYFAGAWTTHQRRLKARGVGSTDWEDFPATLCMSLYLG